MNSLEDLAFKNGLPANLDAERFVLGSVLLNDAVYPQIVDAVEPEDFSLEKHRRIFGRMSDLYGRGERIDRLTLTNELKRHGQLESVDGMSYLLSLDEGLPEIVNLESYIRIVKDKSTLRRGIFAAKAVIEDCLTACDPTPEILNRAESVYAALGTEMRAASFRAPMDVVNRAGGISAFLDADKQRGIESPWPGLNRMLVGRGFLPGQMIVIGARPSMGKTALACQIADYAATRGTGTAFFTLEMPDRSILLRMAAARAQVDSLKVTQGWANQFERHALSEAFADLTDEESCKLWIDDTTGCTVPRMRSALRRLAARHPVGLIVIDYLQLVETTGGSDRRYEQVTEISRGVKRLAREFNAPVIVLAQLNRESEKEGSSRKPQPSQLRDSGSIEQDADVILLPARQDGQDEHSDVLGVDLILAKQRNGPLGKVPLRFLKRYAKFISPDEETRVA